MLKRYFGRPVCSMLGAAWLYMAPAQAHVKWFLQRSQYELLAQPKPAVFCSANPYNICLGLVATVVTVLLSRLNKRFQNCPMDRSLIELGSKWQPFIGLFFGVCSGVSLLSCWQQNTFFAPDMHLHHCCRWIATTEGIIGLGLILGLLSRICGAAMLLILLVGFTKFSAYDCFDLLPQYGIALYFLIAGRGNWSLDGLLKISHPVSALKYNISAQFPRVFVGLGLIGLAFDEKLINPQLALNILAQHPQLNFLLPLGIGHDIFVLCAGIFELMLGTMIVFNIFPRLCIVLLNLLFAMTAVIFGTLEVFGHAPYFGISLVVIAHPRNLCSPADYVTALQSWLTQLRSLGQMARARLLT